MNRVFFNFHIYHKDRNNVIIRAYEANSEDNWSDCLNSGCNIIATNKVSNHAWAKVGTSRFAKRKFN